MEFFKDPKINFVGGMKVAFSISVVLILVSIVTVIAHGGTIRIILAHVLGIPSSRLFALEVPYAGLSRIRVTTDYAQLLFHNRRSAL